MSNAKRDRWAREYATEYCLSSNRGGLDVLQAYQAGYDSRQPEVDKLRAVLKEMCDGACGGNCVACEALEGAE